jgi:hypothetical protein
MLIIHHLLNVERAATLVLHVSGLRVVIGPKITRVQVRPILNPTASHGHRRCQQAIPPVM